MVRGSIRAPRRASSECAARASRAAPRARRGRAVWTGLALGALLADRLAAQAGTPLDVAALPPRAPLGALAGFEMRSRVTFSAEPLAPHRLELTAVFPARVRWYFGLESGDAGARWIAYRFGARALSVDAGGDGWRELQGEERAVSLRRIELREALFAWPDYGAWSSGPAAATSAECPLVDPASQAPLGSLIAALGPDGLPVSMLVRDAAGAPQEELRVVARAVQHGRSWPSELELWSDGELVWRERVERVATDLRLADDYFVPTSARARAALAPIAVETRAVIVPAARTRRVPLARGTGADAVLAIAWSAWQSAERAAIASGARLDPGIAVELTDAGEPVALVFHLARSASAALDGWSEVRTRTALTRVHPRWPESLQNEIELLRASLPARARAGRAYVRLFDLRSAASGSRDAVRAQVVLPYDVSR